MNAECMRGVCEMAEANRLEVLEHEINEAAYAVFVYVGQRLSEIRRDKLYRDAGFKSWSAYCAAGRLDFKNPPVSRESPCQTSSTSLCS